MPEDQINMHFLIFPIYFCVFHRCPLSKVQNYTEFNIMNVMVTTVWLIVLIFCNFLQATISLSQFCDVLMNRAVGREECVQVITLSLFCES